MTDSNLPTLREQNIPERSISSTVETIKSLRINRFLLGAGLVSFAAASGLLILTQYTVFSVWLGFAALVFLGARQLVRKSLALTTNTNQLQIASVEYQLEQIRKQASKCKFLENVEVEGTRTANQADQLLHQYKGLKNILSKKFEITEMTFSRYLGSIEASCLSIGENLIHTKSILENLNLTAKDQTAQWQDQRIQVSGMLKSTDEALRELANLFNSVNEITTKEKHRDQLEQSMLQIKELAERAKIYSKH